MTLAAAAHGGLGLLFLGFGETSLALVNAFALAINIVSVLLVWRTRYFRAGLVLTGLEAVLHLPLLTLLIGVGAGYLSISFVLATVVFLVMPRGPLRYATAVLSAAGALAALIVAPTQPPVIEVEPLLLQILFWWNTATTMVCLVAIAAYFMHQTERAEAALDRERERSEELLRNVLPESIAARLKDSSKAIADRFDAVTVLFADIVGFTRLGQTLPPTELVELLNEMFSTFDELADKHGLEKIKTIGDAYMVVGGVPVPRGDHAAAVADFALGLQRATDRFSARAPLQLRIGIHSGAVVAGVIGRRKLSYDLWGDTVNLASRMESHGAPGAIQVTAATRELLGESFAVEERGEVDVKGIGKVRTFWLKGRAVVRAA